MRAAHRLTSPGFPRRELFRLMSMLMMLVIVGMLMYRTRDPSLWRWLADDDRSVEPTQTGGESTPVAADPSEPEFVETQVSGPDDRQPFEQSEAERLFQAVSDKEPISAEEMPSYWKLMRWSMTQSFDELWERARKDRYFTHLGQAPQKHRGELIALKVSLRRALAHEVEKNSAGVQQVYEAWGVTEESRTGLYCLVYYDQPPQLPLRPSIHEEALFVGYFLKLLSYEDAMGTTRWAPMLIGRLRWRENPARVALSRDRSERNAIPFLVMGALAGVGLLVLWTKRYLAAGIQTKSETKPADHAAIEHWLEDAADNVDSPAETERQVAAGWLELVNDRPKVLPKEDAHAESGDA